MKWHVTKEVAQKLWPATSSAWPGLFNSYTRAGVPESDLVIQVGYEITDYPQCCGFAILKSVEFPNVKKKVVPTNPFDDPTPTHTTIETFTESVFRMIRDWTGGSGVLIADKLGGYLISGIKAIDCKDWTLEPVLSVTNPIHGSDLGLWFLRRPVGKARHADLKELML